MQPNWTIYAVLNIKCDFIYANNANGFAIKVINAGISCIKRTVVGVDTALLHKQTLNRVILRKLSLIAKIGQRETRGILKFRRSQERNFSNFFNNPPNSQRRRNLNYFH